MPIDARIPLGVTVPEPESPFESYGRALSLKNMIELGRERELRAKKLEQEEAEERAIRQVMTRNVGPTGELDYERAIGDMRSVNPAFAIKLGDEWARRKKETAVQAENERELQKKRRGEFAGMLVNVQNPAELQGRVTNAVARGLMTPEEALQWRHMSMIPWDEQQKIVNDTRMMVLAPDAQERAAEARLAAQRAAADQKLQEEQAARTKAAFELQQQIQRANLNKAYMDIYGGRPLTPVQEDVIAHRTATRTETERHHKVMEGKPSGGGGAVQERFDTRRIDAAQKEHDALNAEEQKIYARRAAIGERLKEISAELDATDDATYRRNLLTEKGKLELEYKQGEVRAPVLNQAKKEALARKEAIRGGGYAPPAAVAPKTKSDPLGIR